MERKEFIIRVLTLIGVIILPLVLAIMLVAWGMRACGRHETTAVTDTVTVYDTIKVRKPVAVDSTVIRYQTVTVPAAPIQHPQPYPSTPLENQIVRITEHDTVTIALTDTVHDSVSMQLPITQKVYADSTYKAYVSGFMPSLDSIFIRQRTDVITNTVYLNARRKRWGIGLSAGYGYGLDGRRLTPFVGLSLNYNLISF